MALKISTDINVDFYDKKYILVNAKQFDRGSKFLDEGDGYSRWLDNGSREFSITCYNHGVPVNLNTMGDAGCEAYVRYRKADGYSVFNFCEIDRKGKIIVSLTEQMLASDGICVADLVIVEKGHAEVDPNTCEIININETAVLSTMPIHIDVTEVAVNNSEIESTHEFNLLNKKLEEYWANFEDVMKTSKSWAVGDSGLESRDVIEDTDNSMYYSKISRSYAIGDTDGIRDNEDKDNSKYYSQQSSISSNNAKKSEDNSKIYANNANKYMNSAKEYMDNASSYANKANSHMNSASSYANKANSYMDNAKEYMDNAKEYMNNAKESEEQSRSYLSNTALYASDAREYMNNASNSETNALNSANKAQSYTVGGTGTRVGEDTDNASWYYNEMKDMFNGLNIVFVPKGTISFSELAIAKETAVAGYVYNIKDDFITDETFREGAGMTYTAGTNIYYTIDGEWDCFGGSASPTATVDEVKEYLGI